MARLIDADELKARMYECVIIMPNGEKCMADRAIDAQPTVEVEPVRHGRWMLLPNRTAPSKLFRCSECGNVTEHKHFSQNGYYPFCKDCGAKMDGGIDNG